MASATASHLPALPRRQRAAPDRRRRRAAARTSSTPSTGWPTSTGRRSTLRRRAGRDHGPQELRGHRGLPPEDRPGPSTCSGSPASSCSTRSTTGGCGIWEHGGDAELAVRRRAGPQPGHGRVLQRRPPPAATGYVPLVRTSSAPPALADEAIAAGGGRPARRAGLPAATTRPPTSASTACGPGPRRPASRSSSTSAAPATSIEPGYFRQRPPVPPDFHGGEENFRSVDYMGIPTRPMQTLATLIFDGVLERFPDLRFAAIEQGAIWVPSLDAADGVGRSTPSPATRSGSSTLSLPRPASTSAARSGPRPTPPRTSAGSSSRAGPRSACSPPTSRTSRAAASRSSASRPASTRRTRAEPARQRFWSDNFLDLMGTAGAHLAGVACAQPGAACRNGPPATPLCTGTPGYVENQARRASGGATRRGRPSSPRRCGRGGRRRRRAPASTRSSGRRSRSTGTCPGRRRRATSGRRSRRPARGSVDRHTRAWSTTPAGPATPPFHTPSRRYSSPNRA